MSKKRFYDLCGRLYDAAMDVQTGHRQAGMFLGTGLQGLLHKMFSVLDETGSYFMEKIHSDFPSAVLGLLCLNSAQTASLVAKLLTYANQQPPREHLWTGAACRL